MADKSHSQKTCICKICSAPFVKQHKNGPALYCGPDCVKIADAEQSAIRRVAKGIGVIGSPFTCTSCGLIEPRSGRKQKYCGPCSKEKIKEKSRLYRKSNLEICRERGRKVDAARYGDMKRKEYIKAKRFSVMRRLKNPKARLDHRMGSMLYLALKAKKAGRRWERLVGYDLKELMVHLERQFLKGMSWSNMGEWHVDHILPRSMFSYDDENCDEFKACWSITNLRPLWAGENQKKHGRRTHLI